jgi:hypothetical protein
MTLKARIKSMFPALVQVNSPLTLVKDGLEYTFGFDASQARRGRPVPVMEAPLRHHYQLERALRRSRRRPDTPTGRQLYARIVGSLMAQTTWKERSLPTSTMVAV